MKTILFVDDEVQILRSLSRLFSDSEHKVIRAGSAIEALNVCACTKVDLVVSDMRMPGMDGVELLGRIKQEYPQTFRMILSGYSDEGKILNALQNNVAMAYLFKPWDNEALYQTICKALETIDLFANADLLAAINSMEQLPVLKPYLQEILHAIETDEDIATVSAKIEKDHSISAKVLHVANSACFGKMTGSVKKAVSYLGLHNVKNLILSASIVDTLEISGYGRQFVENLWAHSFLANKILQAILALALPHDDLHLMNAAGLMHNIGIVFLLKCRASQYVPLVVELAQRPDKSLSALEQERFGFTHAQAGGYMLKWWNLPFPIVEAALYHDNPADGRILNKELVCAMHIAQQVASERLGMTPDCVWMPEVYSCLSIDKGQLDTALADLPIRAGG